MCKMLMPGARAFSGESVFFFHEIGDHGPRRLYGAPRALGRRKERSMNEPTEKQTSVACIVVTYNREDFIERCIGSLLAACGPGLDVMVTVINNGSPDGTAEVLAGLPAGEVAVVTKDRNCPLPLVLNEGLEIGHASGADFILLLNDDIEMREGAIVEMIGVCREVEGSIVTPMQIDYRKPDRIDEAMLERIRATPDLVNDAVHLRKIRRYYPQETLIGAALMATPATFARVGDFDPLFRFYGIDDDYCTRARQLGVPLLLATEARMLHMHGKTTDTQQVDKSAWVKRWANMYRARMLFRLKSSEGTLPLNYLKAVVVMLRDIPRFLMQRFPQGAMIAARTLIELLGAYGRLRRRLALEHTRSGRNDTAAG